MCKGGIVEGTLCLVGVFVLMLMAVSLISPCVSQVFKTVDAVETYTLEDVEYTDHALNSHANQDVNAKVVVSWLLAGMCKPEVYVCQDDTIKVFCSIPGIPRPSILVLSTLDTSADMVLSGMVRPRAITGFLPRSNNYKENTLQVGYCVRADGGNLFGVP